MSMRGPGRPKTGGNEIYLGRVRVLPGQDSARVIAWLETFSTAGSRGRVEMVEQLLTGQNNWQPASQSPSDESPEVTALLDDLLDI